ncbi:MAG: lipopolysaccharide heptosyltransferase I [Neisseria sp.]|nr:lipopolysaccharide heptosyltransferase I [Neisseria sp.]
MKVLLTRLSSMGDLIHTLPAVTDLSRARPDIELHWFCEAGFADIARLHPFVKKVHTMRWRYWRKHLTAAETWREMSALRQGLKDERFDAVLDSQGLLKSALFSKWAAAPVRGLDKNSAREPLASLFYRQKFSVQKGLDAVLRNRLLFAQAFDYELPQDLDFGVQVPEQGCLNNLNEPYYVVLHATSRDSKLWRLENWRGLLRRLHAYDASAVYLPWGNEAEKERAEQIAADLPFVYVCERLSLLQAADLLVRAQGVVGVDTGLLHLANALDVPLVGVYTDTDPAKTGVQETAWAKNIGGVAQMPSENEVYDLLLANQAAKRNAISARADKE